MRAAVALGSNVGERLEHLREARDRVFALAGIKPPLLASAVYETAPVDCEPGARNFLNAVIEFGSDLAPADLLKQLREIEVALGRDPNQPRNTSRPIDLDLLYCGGEVIKAGDLQLPHPRMHLRAFVLRPLADIRPELVLPNQTQPVSALVAAAPDRAGVVRSATQW